MRAPLQGTIVTIDVAPGDAVREGQLLLVMNAMKMEHEVHAEASGVVREVTVSAGDTIYEGHPVILIDEGEVDASGEAVAEAIDLDHVRPDLAEVHERHAATLDENRPDAVAAAAAVRSSAPPARTSTSSATPAPSSSTARSPSPPAPASPSRRSSGASPPTA